MAPGILPLLLRDVELNISFYIELTYAGHPQFPRFRALGALEFFLKAQPLILQVYSVRVQQTVEFKTVNE